MWQRLLPLAELPPQSRALREAEGRRIALFRDSEGNVTAIENRCPHRGGPVGAGPLENGALVCPWHGLAFSLESGACESQPALCLARFPVRVVEGHVEVDLAPPPPRDERIHRYLVRYGSPGHVGRFGSIASLAARRGDYVLVATDRGQEIGEVLVGDGEFDADDPHPPAGEALRKLTAAEFAAAEPCARNAELLARAQALAPQVALLDAELTFDGGTLILYHPAAGDAALGPLAAHVAEQLDVARVQFETLTPAAGTLTSKAAVPPGAPDMRGPYERLKYDFRRVWECPACHHRERTPGSVTSLFCPCQAKVEPTKQVPMKLIDDGPRRADGKPLPVRKSSLP